MKVVLTVRKVCFSGGKLRAVSTVRKVCLWFLYFCLAKHPSVFFIMRYLPRCILLGFTFITCLCPLCHPSSQLHYNALLSCVLCNVTYVYHHKNLILPMSFCCRIHRVTNLALGGVVPQIA